jgi:hypothetical protein
MDYEAMWNELRGLLDDENDHLANLEALNAMSELHHKYSDIYIKKALTASDMGKKGGSAKTEAKIKSSKENGKKGGRPKKIKE